MGTGWHGVFPAATTQFAEDYSVDLDATQKVLDRLVEHYPGLKPQIERGVSLALDGRIYRESWFTEVRPDSEVVLMPYMAGG